MPHHQPPFPSPQRLQFQRQGQQLGQLWAGYAKTTDSGGVCLNIIYHDAEQESKSSAQNSREGAAEEQDPHEGSHLLKLRTHGHPLQPGGHHGRLRLQRRLRTRLQPRHRQQNLRNQHLPQGNRPRQRPPMASLQRNQQHDLGSTTGGQHQRPSLPVRSQNRQGDLPHPRGGQLHHGGGLQPQRAQLLHRGQGQPHPHLRRRNQEDTHQPVVSQVAQTRTQQPRLLSPLQEGRARHTRQRRLGPKRQHLGHPHRKRGLLHPRRENIRRLHRHPREHRTDGLQPRQGPAAAVGLAREQTATHLPLGRIRRKHQRLHLLRPILQLQPFDCHGGGRQRRQVLPRRGEARNRGDQLRQGKSAVQLRLRQYGDALLDGRQKRSPLLLRQQQDFGVIVHVRPWDVTVTILWMGGSTGKPEQRSQRVYMEDPRYGGTVIFSKLTNTVYQMLLLDQRTLPPFSSLLQHRKQLLHPHLVTLRNSFTRTPLPSFSCHSNSTEMYIEYPYLTRSLEDLIEEHSDSNREIPESEILRIFCGVAKALRFLEENRSCHGDVKAASIVFDHLNEPKIIDSYFVNGGKTAYEIVLEDPSSMSLLSPEQMERIKHRQFEDLLTIHEDEVFAFGMTLLEAMTLEPAMEAYDLNKLLIKEDYHHRKAAQLTQSSYSPQLTAFALRCISLKAGERPSLAQLAGWFSQNYR